MNARSATAIDIEIGRRLRLFRTAAGLSQAQLAQTLGITFQQVQKYERGTNRIGSGRLYEAAQVLGIAVASFFEGLGASGDAADDQPKPVLADDIADLARRIASISGTAERKRTVDRVRAMLDEIAI